MILIETESSKLERALKLEKKWLRSIRSSVRRLRKTVATKTAFIASGYDGDFVRLANQEVEAKAKIAELKSQLASCEG